MKFLRNKSSAETEETKTDPNSKTKGLVKKFGVGAFIFFTVKGIITTSLMVGAYFGVKGCM